MKKIIQISDRLFWGFNEIIEIDNYKSFDELGEMIKKELLLFLNRNNLLYLVMEAEKLNLHNHNYEKYDDLYKTNNDIIYFCGHCCN